MPRCKAKTKLGSKCARMATTDGYCTQHAELRGETKTKTKSRSTLDASGRRKPKVTAPGYKAVKSEKTGNWYVRPTDESVMKKRMDAARAGRKSGGKSSEAPPGAPASAPAAAPPAAAPAAAPPGAPST